jgi:ABC-type phosphate transport system auxiliary subunit
MYSQDADFSLAKVGKKIYGVYVFFGCEPANPYTYVKTIEVKIDWSDSYYDSFEKAIEKAKKKESNFNGIIFQTENLNKADLIRFNDLEASRGGFSYGSKASFIDNGQVYVGEIVELETSKGDATIRFKNVFFEDETKKISYTKLTPISNEIFLEKQKEIEKQSEKYKFQIGEKVYWIAGNVLGQNKKQYSGEIVSLDNKSHKATVKYLDSENKETISTISYRDLNKTE